jgi:hypothetical protein
VPGSVSRVEVRTTPHGFLFRIAGTRTNGWFTADPTGRLVPSGPVRAAAVAALTASGAEPVASAVVGGPCGVVARDKGGAGGTRVIELTARPRAERTIGEPFGAGLAGLPLP